MMASRRFRCFDCGYEWDVPFGTGPRGVDLRCPRCGSANVHRIDDNPPPMVSGRGYGRGQGGYGQGAGQGAGRGMGRGQGRGQGRGRRGQGRW